MEFKDNTATELKNFLHCSTDTRPVRLKTDTYLLSRVESRMRWMVKSGDASLMQKTGLKLVTPKI
jgi:hypothetical protein